MLCTPRRWTFDERTSESKRQQQEERNPQREQQEMAQPAVFDRAWRLPFEKHQRTEWTWVTVPAAQQVEIQRQGHCRRTRQKPWRKQAQSKPPLAQAEIFP